MRPSPEESPASATLSATPRPEAAGVRGRTRATRVSDVLQQAAAALTARAKSRGIILSVDAGAERRSARVGALRESFLILLADTVETAAHGSVVSVRLKDLAGGRVELRIVDSTTVGSLTDRAFRESDASGRSRSLQRAFERLANEHQTRWVSDVDAEGRKLILDIGFPGEE